MKTSEPRSSRRPGAGHRIYGGAANVVFTMKPGDISAPVNLGGSGAVLSVVQNKIRRTPNSRKRKTRSATALSRLAKMSSSGFS